MFFSKNKKLQRDRNAGLVFRWRGGYALNRGGSTIAFIVTSIIFASGFILLNVYAKQNTVPSRYRASMIQLEEMDDDLRWWVERNSPYLPDLSVDEDKQSNARVETMLEERLREEHSGAYLYKDVEMQKIEIGNEGGYTLNHSWLPSVKRFEVGGVNGSSDRIGKKVTWKLKVAASEALAGRLPDQLEYGGWIPEKWRGRSVRLIVAVDAKGKVLSVNPVEWTESETVKKLVNWMHTIDFKTAEKESPIFTGVIHLSYLPTIKNESKEEQP